MEREKKHAHCSNGSYLHPNLNLQKLEARYLHGKGGMATEIKLRLRGLLVGYNVIRKASKRQKNETGMIVRSYRCEYRVRSGCWGARNIQLSSASYELEGKD